MRKEVLARWGLAGSLATGSVPALTHAEVTEALRPNPDSSTTVVLEQNQQEGPQPVPVLSERLRVNFEGDVRENPAVQAITQVYSEALKNVILESPQYSGTNITDYEMVFGRNGDGLVTGVLVNETERLAFIVNPFSPVIEPVTLVEGAEVSFAQVEGFIGVHPVVRFPDNQVAVLGQVEGEEGLTGMPLPEGTLVTMVDTFTSPILPQGRVNAPSGLNLREGASTNDTRIGLLENGTSFGVIGETNGWLNIVLSNGQRGWVFKDFTTTPQPTQVPTPRLLIETLATPSTPEPSRGVEGPSLSFPELYGEVIHSVLLTLPNGTQTEMVVRGNIQQLENNGYVLLDPTRQTDRLIQKYADQVLIGTPNEIRVISVDNSIRRERPIGREFRAGEIPLTVDLTRGIDIVLVPREDMVPGLKGSYTLAENGFWADAIYIEPNSRDKLILYFFTNPVIFESEEGIRANNFHFFTTAIEMIEFFQQLNAGGEPPTDSELSLALAQAFRGGRAPWLGRSDEIIQIIRDGLSTFE